MEAVLRKRMSLLLSLRLSSDTASDALRVPRFWALPPCGVKCHHYGLRRWRRVRCAPTRNARPVAPVLSGADFHSGSRFVRRGFPPVPLWPIPLTTRLCAAPKRCSLG
ncbi:hypothetical protein PF008_g19361 [Phytophthora fragariae]|uniref:Uncharacterized protein n=1 Tax=Phytophthora fragariae TaxID=53985 RepID=A0A6G0R2M4_9STRA|nr:hypothetical protein PF008_g19361 [Phytophthora fragariae]